MTLEQHHRHHVPTLVRSHEAHPHRGAINRWLAVHVTSLVGTMYCAYLFVALSFYGLPAALSGGAGAFVQWASSQFIQLVLLPIIMVGQAVQQNASDARAEADHQTQTALLEINRHQLEILEALHASGS